MARITQYGDCVAMVEACRKAGVPLMVHDNTESHRTAFTYTVDYVHGTSTGISASDRAATMRALTDPATTPSDLARPGHIFPLRYAEGGVLKRAGHTEAAVDLATLAGLAPAGVICEIMNDDGTMARMPDLVTFARQHGLKIVTIADLIQYRLRNEKLVRRGAEAIVPTRAGGDMRAIVYENDIDHVDHVALVKGEIRPDDPVLVRVHSECLTGDALGSLRCDCRDQLETALRALASRHAGEAERRAVLARGLGDPDGYVAGYARQALLGPKRI